MRDHDRLAEEAGASHLTGRSEGIAGAIKRRKFRKMFHALDAEDAGVVNLAEVDLGRLAPRPGGAGSPPPGDAGHGNSNGNSPDKYGNTNGNIMKNYGNSDGSNGDGGGGGGTGGSVGASGVSGGVSGGGGGGGVSVGVGGSFGVMGGGAGSGGASGGGRSASPGGGGGGGRSASPGGGGESGGRSGAADVNVLAMMADVRAAAGYCNGPVGLEGFIAAMEAVMETTR